MDTAVPEKFIRRILQQILPYKINKEISIQILKLDSLLFTGFVKMAWLNNWNRFDQLQLNKTWIHNG